MYTYEIQVMEELVEVSGVESHVVNEHGYLQLSNSDRVIAMFKDWNFFNSFED